VSDEDHRDAGPLGQACQLRRAFAYLTDRARRRTELLRPQRLDRVDHRHPWRRGLQRRQDLLEIDLGQQPQPAGCQRQSPRTQCDLLSGFLTADVENVFLCRQAG